MIMQSYRFLSIVMVYKLRKRIPELLYLQVGGCGTFGVGILVAIRSLRILRADNFTFWCKKKCVKNLQKRKKGVPLHRFWNEREGRLAQPVQSICLTSRGSGVRIPQRPPRRKTLGRCLFCFMSSISVFSITFLYFNMCESIKWTIFVA